MNTVYAQEIAAHVNQEVRTAITAALIEARLAGVSGERLERLDKSLYRAAACAADVVRYVNEGTPLPSSRGADDLEALKRAAQDLR